MNFKEHLKRRYFPQTYIKENGGLPNKFNTSEDIHFTLSALEYGLAFCGMMNSSVERDAKYLLYTLPLAIHLAANVGSKIYENYRKAKTDRQAKEFLSKIGFDYKNYCDE